MRVIIALGGNLGDQRERFAFALARIAALAGTRVTARSSLYETPALTLQGIDESAPKFLNAVIAVETELSPRELLEELQRIEDEAGRERAVRWGNRTLDLDIIAADDLVIDEPGLHVPHPRAHERAFVLRPWLEIDPDAQLTGRGPVAELVRSTSDPVSVLGPFLAEGAT